MRFRPLLKISLGIFLFLPGLFYSGLYGTDKPLKITENEQEMFLVDALNELSEEFQVIFFL